MTESKVATFFYGSYMNLEVLKEVELIPDQVEVARLPGFDIRIQPLANLVRSDQHTVFGILIFSTHPELERLYSHAKDVLGSVYFPEPVLTQTLDGKLLPALCYLAPVMEPRPPGNEYIDRIMISGRQYGFPSWYLEKLESFRP